MAEGDGISPNEGEDPCLPRLSRLPYRASRASVERYFVDGFVSVFILIPVRKVLISLFIGWSVDLFLAKGSG